MSELSRAIFLLPDNKRVSKAPSAMPTDCACRDKAGHYRSEPSDTAPMERVECLIQHQKKIAAVTNGRLEAGWVLAEAFGLRTTRGAVSDCPPRQAARGKHGRTRLTFPSGSLVCAQDACRNDRDQDRPTIAFGSQMATSREIAAVVGIMTHGRTARAERRTQVRSRPSVGVSRRPESGVVEVPRRHIPPGW